jgi:molybdenum cofactor cytidylyltransferase
MAARCIDLQVDADVTFGSLTGVPVSSNPVVVVLAAGKGSRFAGVRHKLEQPLGTTSVLGSTLSNALGSGLPVVVVTTRALSASVQRYVAARDIVFAAEGPQAGMGDSIATGVAARAQASGWVVLPGDMPLIRPDTIIQVAAQLDNWPVVYAQHHGRRGHPVAFAAELYSELVKLAGDEGARRLLGRYPTHGVDVRDAGVMADIDTIEDLAAAQRMHEGRQRFGGSPLGPRPE